MWNPFAWVKSAVAARKWHRSPLGRQLATHALGYFDSEPILAALPNEQKDAMVRQFYIDVFAALDSDNPILQMRRQIVAHAAEFARFQVLCLDEGMVSKELYRDNPYISGTLYRHIAVAVEQVEELRTLRSSHPDADDDYFLGYATLRTMVELYFLTGFNMVRSAIGDVAENDWFLPLHEALVALEESEMRQKLGLENLFLRGLAETKSDELVEADSLQLPEAGYAFYIDLVEMGIPDPLSAWAKGWTNTPLGPFRPA